MTWKYSEFYVGGPDVRYLGALVGLGLVGFGSDTLGPELRELVRIRSGQVNGCHWCATARSIEVRDQGLTEERIRQIGDVEHSDLTEREKVALLFLDRLTLDWDSIDAEFQARLRAAFTQTEIADLCWLAILGGAQRIAGIFDVEPPEYETGNRVELGDGTWTFSEVRAQAEMARAEST